MTDPNLFDAAVKPPKLSDQCARVVNVLRNAEWTSAWELSRRASVLCYTKRISELRRAGYVIEIKWHKYAGDGQKRFSEYRLVSEPGR